MPALPVRTQSVNIQTSMASPPAMNVFTAACAATPLACMAFAGLSPSQPNQSRPRPMAMSGMLLGRSSSPGANTRLRTTHTEASAAKPALACTTMPPPKSSTPHFCRNPPPQTACANGM
jgi:hypothetical protein